MAEPDNRLGFWVPIRDRDSALYAIRMTGLPVFLIGLTLVLSGALSLADPLRPPLWGAILLGLAVAFIAAGLALRAGKRWLVPPAAAIVLILVLVEAFFVPSWALVLRGLIALMAISGLRGWLWLRRHRARPADAKAAAT